jgi:hypothetical protein
MTAAHRAPRRAARDARRGSPPAVAGSFLSVERTPPRGRPERNSIPPLGAPLTDGRQRAGEREVGEETDPPHRGVAAHDRARRGLLASPARGAEEEFGPRGLVLRSRAGGVEGTPPRRGRRGNSTPLPPGARAQVERDKAAGPEFQARIFGDELVRDELIASGRGQGSRSHRGCVAVPSRIRTLRGSGSGGVDACACGRPLARPSAPRAACSAYTPRRSACAHHRRAAR